MVRRRYGGNRAAPHHEARSRIGGLHYGSRFDPVRDSARIKPNSSANSNRWHLAFFRHPVDEFFADRENLGQLICGERCPPLSNAGGKRS